jgi:hypothetical protein
MIRHTSGIYSQCLNQLFFNVAMAMFFLPRIDDLLECECNTLYDSVYLWHIRTLDLMFPVVIIPRIHVQVESPRRIAVTLEVHWSSMVSDEHRCQTLSPLKSCT